jgi:hypothetical protein
MSLDVDGLTNEIEGGAVVIEVDNNHRMKADETTNSAGFAAVLGFNLRQLTRYLVGEVRPKLDEIEKNKSSDAIFNQSKVSIACG